MTETECKECTECPKPHKKWLDFDTLTEEDCNGILRYDDMQEGCMCDKCSYYTGVK